MLAPLAFDPWFGGSTEPDLDHLFGSVDWPQDGASRAIAGEKYWRQPREWNRHAAEERTVFRVLCGVETDWLEEWNGAIVGGGDNEVGVTLDHLRANLFSMIDNTPSLCWLMLTSRPENFDRFWDRKRRKNVWLGARVRDQIDANHRLPFLHDAKRRGYVHRTFALCDSMRGQVTLRGSRRRVNHLGSGGLDVVVFTEGIRDEWRESLRIQGEKTGVPIIERSIPCLDS